MKTVERTRIWVREVIRISKQKDTRIGTQDKVIMPIYDMIDETYIWSWAEVNGESGEWMLGGLQHTRNEQQRAKEAWLILKTAIKMEQASTHDKSKPNNETTEKEQEKNRAEPGTKMLQELEEHIEREKRNKRHKKT